MAETFRVGYVTGATPDKWARAWRDRERGGLELMPVIEADQAAALAEDRVAMCLVRLPVVGEDLHVVRLYDERPVAVLGVDHAATTVEELTLDDLDDEQLLVPHVSGWRPSSAQQRWPEMTLSEAIEVVASGTGVVLVPMSVARLHHRRDVTFRPVVDLPETTVALAWRRDRDDERAQRFVGVVRGRSSRSSRD